MTDLEKEEIEQRSSLKIGDQVIVRSPSKPKGTVIKITKINDKRFIEVDIGDHIYCRYSSSFELIGESK